MLFAWGFSTVDMFRFPSESTGFRDADLVGKHHLLEALHSIGALMHTARSGDTVPGVGRNIVERYPFSFLEQVSQTFLRMRVASLRSLTSPLRGFTIVSRHPIAVVIHHQKSILCQSDPLLC